MASACVYKRLEVFIQHLYTESIHTTHQHGCCGHASPHTPSNFSLLLKKKKATKGREAWREIHTRINKRFQKAPCSSGKEKGACI